MSRRSRIPVYIGYGNILTLTPFSDVTTDERLDMTGATKVEVCVGSVSSDSDTLPDEIWWELDSAVWVIRIRPGLIPGIVAGEQDMRVVAFDSDFEDGLVLTHDLKVLVIEDC